MPISFIIIIAVSVFLAMNIGANNSAAEMSAAYGAGVRTKKQALTLIAIFCFLGAVSVGQPVIKTLSRGIASGKIFTENFSLIFIVLIVTALFVFWANFSKIPIATTHAIVCSVAGVGFCYRDWDPKKFFIIAGWWVVTPLIAGILSYWIGKHIYFRILHWLAELKSEAIIKKILGILITFSGCYVAYSAGSNNAANSVGPLVSGGIISSFHGAFLAGAGMSVGALIFGGRVMETVGKEITEIGIVRAILVETICATLILIASLSGIPISLGETVTSAIIGLSVARSGFRATLRNEHVNRILILWCSLPFLAFGLAYFLAKIFRGLNIGS